MFIYIVGILIIIIVCYWIYHNNNNNREGMQPIFATNKYFTIGETSESCDNDYLKISGQNTCNLAGLRMGLDNDNILTDICSNIYTDMSFVVGNYADNNDIDNNKANFVWFVGDNNSCSDKYASIQSIYTSDMCKQAFSDLSDNNSISNITPYTNDSFMHVSNYCIMDSMTGTAGPAGTAEPVGPVDLADNSHNNISFAACVSGCYLNTDCSMVLYDISSNVCYEWEKSNNHLNNILNNERKICNNVYGSKFTAPVVKKLSISSDKYNAPLGCSINTTDVSGTGGSQYSQLKYSDTRYIDENANELNTNLCYKPYSNANCYISNTSGTTQLFYDDYTIDNQGDPNTHAICLQDNSYNQLLFTGNKGANGYGDPNIIQNERARLSYYAIKDASLCEQAVSSINSRTYPSSTSYKWKGVKDDKGSLMGCYVDNNADVYYNITDVSCTSTGACNNQNRLYLGTDYQACEDISSTKYPNLMKYTNISYVNNRTTATLTCGDMDDGHETYSTPNQYIFNCNNTGKFDTDIDIDKIGDISFCLPVPGDCAGVGVFSEWSDWSKCSASCNGGTQTRRRTVSSNFESKTYYDQCSDPVYTIQDISCNLQSCSTTKSGYSAEMNEIRSNSTYGAEDKDYRFYDSDAQVINNCSRVSYQGTNNDKDVQSCPTDTCVKAYDETGTLQGKCCPFNYTSDNTECKDCELKFWRYDTLTNKVDVPWDCSGGNGIPPTDSNNILLSMFNKGFDYFTGKVDKVLDRNDGTDELFNYNVNPQMSTLMKLQSIQKDLGIIDTQMQSSPDSMSRWTYPATSSMPATFADYQKTYSYTDPDRTILAINSRKEPYPIGSYTDI
jgi:hypothetical protein